MKKVKKLQLALLIATIFQGSEVFAQQDGSGKSVTRPTTSKGYYALPANAATLPVSIFSNPDSVSLYTPAKGFYTVQPATKPLKRSWWKSKGTKPVITKGYYSIEGNAKNFPGVSK